MEQFINRVSLSVVQRGVLKAAVQSLRNGKLWRTLAPDDVKKLEKYETNPDDAIRVLLQNSPQLTAILEARVNDLVIAQLMRTANIVDTATGNVKKIETEAEASAWLSERGYPESHLAAVFAAYRLITEEQSAESRDSILQFFYESTQAAMWKGNELFLDQAKKSIVYIASDPEVQQTVGKTVTDLLADPEMSVALSAMISTPSFVNAAERLGTGVVQAGVDKVEQDIPFIVDEIAAAVSPYIVMIMLFVSGSFLISKAAAR